MLRIVMSHSHNDQFRAHIEEVQTTFSVQQRKFVTTTHDIFVGPLEDVLEWIKSWTSITDNLKEMK